MGFSSVEPSWFEGLADLVMGGIAVVVLLVLMRVRRRTLGWREVLDAVAVMVGSGLTTWVVLANPLIDGGTAPPLAIIATVYLPLATLIVTFAAELTFEGHVHNRAMQLALGCALLNLLSASLRAAVDAGTLTWDASRLVVAILVAALALASAAIANRDAALLIEGHHGADDALTPYRETLQMAPLIISLATPLVLIATVSPTSTADSAVRGVAALALVAAIVGRLFVALEAYAATQRRLAYRLERDELTNLLTRPRFVQTVAEVLDATWRSEHHATVIQINVDRFKNINDTLGHDAANRLLVSVAERLRVVADEFGGVVARAAGDDFLIVDRTTTNLHDAEQRAERLKEAFAPPFTLDQTQVFVTASIGVAVAPRHRTVTAEELLRRADIATHRAKSDGRNRCVVFDESMQSNLAQRMDVEHALHGAIGRREMHLYYQPIVDIVTGRLSGFEALMRWRRSDGTIVPPMEFIAIAEETGIINELGAWALEESLRELRGWINDGTVPDTTTMSVNVSPRQIADHGFADIVRNALETSGLSPHLLWLEMTESMMLDEPDLAQSTLRKVRGSGVRLALDDFGTGYSSLSLLQQFPIQRIKIDRAFVQGIADHSNDRSLVRTIIAMAQSMGLDLVAEGVETVHQMQSLRDLGCDKAQGYLISRPVPPQAMRTTMVALVELAELALFGPAGQTRPGHDISDRWLDSPATVSQPLGRHLVARPIR